jgi:hypothetical protein
MREIVCCFPGSTWRGLFDCHLEVLPFAGPVLLRAVGESGRSPLLEDHQARTPVEHRLWTLGIVFDSVLLRHLSGFLH